MIISFQPLKVDEKDAVYNFGRIPYSTECPGMSVFIQLEDGRICHSYSLYARFL